MRIEYSDGLLLAALAITYKGQRKIIDRMAIDTGAAHTIIVSDAVDDIGHARRNMQGSAVQVRMLWVCF